jgi:hypothetical protein
VILNGLLRYLQDDHHDGGGHGDGRGDVSGASAASAARGASYGCGLALALFGSQLAQALFDSCYFWAVLRAGLRARVALVAAVAAKTLRLSHAARGAHSSGRLNALIAADAEAIELCLGTLHLCWSAPLRIVVALALLYAQLGAAAFAALGALFLLLPVQVGARAEGRDAGGRARAVGRAKRRICSRRTAAHRP